MTTLKIQSSDVKAGAWAGAIGGVAFGVLMGLMGALPMVAALLGSESAFFGFVLHIVFSVIIGILFAVFFGSVIKDQSQGVMLGLVTGFIWWILGPLTLMPVWLGMGAQLGADGVVAALPSLWGHLLFGFVLGLAFALQNRE